MARADRALSGTFEFFGHTCALGRQIDWHADPITRETWPLVFHGDVPLGDSITRRGDVKHVWELNRHQFLLDLSRAWLLTGDSTYSDEVDRIVASWRAANPYGLGVNWNGPLEVAYRALSWLWAYGITTGAGSRDESAWLEGFYEHGRYLHSHLELYSSPYNHLIGEAAVLFVLGVVFPELADASRWKRRGRQVLEHRLKEQFFADGGSVEQATVYHHATLGFYLLAALAGRANGEELSDPVWAAIERAIDFSMRLQQPDGLLPAIGDNDDARPVVFECRDSWDFRYYQAIGAALFGRGDFKVAAGRFYEEALWLLGPDGATIFDRLEPMEPDVSSHLSGSGYVVLRTERGADADYVLFDCGDQAGGLRHDAVPSAAHGHADSLAVILWLGGQPVLVDSGYFTYNGDVAQERHYRETAAHNTLRIDRQDQALHHSKMAWSHTPRVTVEHAAFLPGGGVAAARHDGYRRLRRPVEHSRTVWFAAGGYVVVLDRLTGEAGAVHDIEANWHLSPGLQAMLTPNDQAVLSGRFILAWAGTAPATARAAHGGDAPDAGWVAPHLGVRVPATRLTIEARTEVPFSLVTVVADLDRWRAVELQRSGALYRVTLTGSSARESLQVSPDQPDVTERVERLTEDLEE